MNTEPDKRERILAAASGLFLSAGLQAPMSAIAAAAGVATGTPYTYFQSKDDLVLAVFERVCSRLNAAMISRVDLGLPLRSRCEAYIDAYIDHIWSDPTQAMLYEVIANAPQVVAQKVGPLFEDFIAFSIAVFSETDGAEGSAGGAAMPKNLMASFVRGAVRNTLKRQRIAGGSLTPEIKQQIIAMCWAALRA